MGFILRLLFYDYLNQQYFGKGKGLEAHKEFQAIRILDDYLFQGIVRQEFNEWAKSQGINASNFGDKWDEANAKLMELMSNRKSEVGFRYQFPWPRSFEIKVLP